MPFSLIVDCAREQTTTPGLDCVILQFTNIARFILSITGSVALLIFVVAGFMYLINAGNPEQAKKATSYITNAAIGLVIIFCSGILVNYLQRQLRNQDTTDAACNALGNGYSCMETTQTPGTNCQSGLCLSNSSTTYLCCQQPSAETQTPPTTPSVPNPVGCSDMQNNIFLGCTANNCQSVGAPCQQLGVGAANCLQISSDIRCTQELTTPSIYGCYSGTGANRQLFGCVEVNDNDGCDSLCEGQEFCGFVGPTGRQPDPACFNQ